MRTAFSILLLFAVAVALALLAGNNQSTVTLFWPPHRVDMSLNLVLLLLLLAFGVVHLALRALGVLLSIPRSAQRWRQHQRERAMFLSMLDALSHLVAGRFIRARKSAELALVHEARLASSDGGDKITGANRLRAMAHLLAAESAHALLDRDARMQHWHQAKEHSAQRDAHEEHEGVQLRAARWALDDRDAGESLRLLAELPQGVGRRTVALRLRLKAARQAGQTTLALETARLLVKHKAFSTAVGASILQGLVLSLLRDARAPSQLQAVWSGLDIHEQQSAPVILAAAHAWLDLGGDSAQARAWLLPLWPHMLVLTHGAPSGGSQLQQAGLPASDKTALTEALARSFVDSDPVRDKEWLARIEAAQMARPGDPYLLYLAGIACMRLQLWGKAHQMLRQSAPQLRNTLLERAAWMALAQLGEQRGDDKAVAEAYRKAVSANPAGTDAFFLKAS